MLKKYSEEEPKNNNKNPRKNNLKRKKYKDLHQLQDLKNLKINQSQKKSFNNQNNQLLFKNKFQARKQLNRRNLHLKKKNFLKKCNNFKGKQKNKLQTKRKKSNNNSNHKNLKINWVT